MELFRLFGSIFVDNEKANESISKTEKKAGGLASTLGKGIKTAAKFGTAVIGGASVAAGGVFALANKAADTTDRIDKMSQKLGISRKGFQEWDFILSQSGTSVDGLKGGMKTLTNIVDDLSKGGKVATEAFGELGIKYTDLEGLSQEEIFEKTIVALQGVEDKTKRAALANDLLGKSGQELGPLLNAGAKSVENMRKKANELGLVLGDDAIDAGVKFTDTMDQIKRSLGSVVANVGAAALPMIQKFADFILENMPLIQDVATVLFEALSGAVETFIPLLMDVIKNALPPLIDLFSVLIEGVLPPLIELFGGIVADIFPILIELFTSLITEIVPVFMLLLDVIVKNILPPLLELFTMLIKEILPPLIAFFGEIIATLLPPLIELFAQIIDAVMPILIELFREFIDKVLPPLMELIDEIVKNVLPPLLEIFMELVELVLPLVMEIFEALEPVIEPAMNAIAAIIKTVLALIKGDWEGVWSGIKEFFQEYIGYVEAVAEGFSKVFSRIFGGIKDTVLDVWDGLVDGIKSGINWIIEGINTFINGINKLKIPKWVPVVGGKGINLSTIPKLKEGGDTTRSGLAIVGDAGPELLELKPPARVTPLDDERSPMKTENNFKLVIQNMNVQDGTDFARKANKEFEKFQLRDVYAT